MQNLRENQLYAKFSKGEFFEDKGKYLSHTISIEWVYVYSDKNKDINEWPTPNYVLNVKSFMGLVGHYRIFIEQISKIAHLITSLQIK